MNLDSTAEKEKMIDAYHAYLENTPGSKKALHELLTKKHLIGLKTELPSPKAEESKPKDDESKIKAEKPKLKSEAPKPKAPEKSINFFS